MRELTLEGRWAGSTSRQRGGQWSRSHAALCAAIAVAACRAAWTARGGVAVGRVRRRPARELPTSPVLGLAWASGNASRNGSDCTREITERCVCVDHGPRDACIRHVASRCGEDRWLGAAALRPPGELLARGQLTARASLSDQSLCYLWYAGSFSMQASGGLALSRQGGPVDDKALLARCGAIACVWAPIRESCAHFRISLPRTDRAWREWPGTCSCMRRGSTAGRTACCRRQSISATRPRAIASCTSMRASLGRTSLRCGS